LESKIINPEIAKQEVDLKEAFSGFELELLRVKSDFNKLTIMILFPN